MKKLFLAFALLLFTSTTFAFTLTGTIADKLDQTGLEGVQITLDGKKKRASIGKGVFTIPNIDITAGNPAKFQVYYPLDQGEPMREQFKRILSI